MAETDCSEPKDATKKTCWQTVCLSRFCLPVLAVAILAGVAVSVAVVLTSEGMRERFPPDMKWWKKTVVYQIYPRSFKDSNGDGIGDLRGITSKLDYFTYLNVKAIWISPFYPSPMADFGYDVSNYTDVDPMFGDLDDFDALLKQAHRLGIRVIIDFVASHTSSAHQWFNLSVQGIPPYDNYYIWTNGTRLDNGTIVPPSNWMSIFGYSAWKWVEERQQYYYHAFLEQQPALNYRSPQVHEEMKDVLRFWLKRGVDGIRVDAVSNMMVYEDYYQDQAPSKAPGTEPSDSEPVSEQAMADNLHEPLSYGPPHTGPLLYTSDGRKWFLALDSRQREIVFLVSQRCEIVFLVSQRCEIVFLWQADYYHNNLTSNIPDIFPVISEWRKVLDEFDDSDDDKDDSKLMIVEAAGGAEERNRFIAFGADLPFNFDLVQSIDRRYKSCGAICIRDVIQKEYDSLPEGGWANFVFSNHDNPRAITRLGAAYADAMNMLLLTLRGTPTTYYGEELGMEDIKVSYVDTQDPYGKRYGPDHYTEVSRDPERAPMQWDDSMNAGFSNKSTPWLPVHPDYLTVNVEAEKNSTNTTALQVYRDLANLRQQPSLRYGRLQFCVVTSGILSYIRSAYDHPDYLVVINFGNVTETQDFSGSPVHQGQGRVKVATSGAANEGRFSKEQVVPLIPLSLGPGDGLVLELGSSTSS
ncbi:hypothetical protein BaRGS_00033458 [Batillaria attramentaria]|uniref:Glycosyl hydrolase family 13 catalytic domain-containing protein n=1 Tax=Batillaria attramentaria TaxID=370345 RepID=A0ABD0JKA4_9CAEN